MPGATGDEGRALMGLSDYEVEQLKKVREHRERELSRSPRRLVPESQLAS
jgi:hypothetical protein